MGGRLEVSDRYVRFNDDSPAVGLKHEPGGVDGAWGGEEEGKVGGGVGVGVGLDEAGGALVFPAEFAGGAGEGRGADEGEGVVGQGAGDGVDVGEVQAFVGGAGEVLDGELVGGADGGLEEAEGVGAGVASDAVLPAADEEERAGSGNSDSSISGFPA